MADITLRLSLTNDNGESIVLVHVFDVCEDLETDIEQFVEDYNGFDEDASEFELDDREVITYDTDYADPSDFDDLNEYGEYVEKCDEHGDGYRLRYADIGDFDFDDQYNGCWNSEEEFVEELYTECNDIPDHLRFYIDWEKLTRDFMMDYSSYEANDGLVYIFCDC